MGNLGCELNCENTVVGSQIKKPELRVTPAQNRIVEGCFILELTKIKARTTLGKKISDGYNLTGEMLLNHDSRLHHLKTIPEI